MYEKWIGQSQSQTCFIDIQCYSQGIAASVVVKLCELIILHYLTMAQR